MESQKPKTRLRVGIVVVIVLAAAFVANAVHLHLLERDLQVVVNNKIQEFEKDNAQFTGEFRMASSAIVTKSLVLFGEVSGKSNIYRQALGDDQEAKIEGYEYWYAREGEDWVQTDSGRCTSEECTVEGLKLLRALDKY